jgi:hypothetical protein
VLPARLGSCEWGVVDNFERSGKHTREVKRHEGLR